MNIYSYMVDSLQKRLFWYLHLFDIICVAFIAHQQKCWQRSLLSDDDGWLVDLGYDKKFTGREGGCILLIPKVLKSCSLATKLFVLLFREKGMWFWQTILKKKFPKNPLPFPSPSYPSSITWKKGFVFFCRIDC